jgi:hypothetical protein
MLQIITVAGCVMAGILNISGFFIVGGLSAITYVVLVALVSLLSTTQTHLSPLLLISSYQVLANMKTVAILIFGKLLFGEAVTTQQVIGVSCGIIGLLGYTKYKVKGTSQTDPLVSGVRCGSLAQVRRMLLSGFLAILVLAWCCYMFVNLDQFSRNRDELAAEDDLTALASYVENIVLDDNLQKAAHHPLLPSIATIPEEVASELSLF